MGACYLREFCCSNVKIFYSKAADIGADQRPGCL